MKRVWIYYSRDGPIVYSNPRKIWERWVKDEVQYTYATYLKKLREDNGLSLEDDTSIGVFEVN